METSLVPWQQREVTPAIWNMLDGMAPVMHESRLFGVTSKAAAAAIMLKGYELGLGITASFEFVQVIQGKPTLSPRGALAILLNSPQIEAIKIDPIVDDKGVYKGHQCYMRRAGGFEYTAKFTIEDAQRAGLVKAGSAWTSYPANMCLWRAVGFAADVVAPDITAGMTAIMKMPEKFGITLTEGGDVVEGQVVEATPAAVQTATLPAPEPNITLEWLLTQYSAEQIVVAGEGKLPETAAELQGLAAKLGAV